MLQFAAGQSAPIASLKLKAEEDYLELHIKGATNLTASRWQWRIIYQGDEESAVSWQLLDAPLPDGTFLISVPVSEKIWSRVEVQAILADKVIKTVGVSKTPSKALTLLTPERVSLLPDDERTAWLDYLQVSQQLAKHEQTLLADECRKAGRSVSRPAPSSSERFECPKKPENHHFSSVEAQALADVILSYQTPSGAWSKGIDYTKGKRQPGTHWTTQSSPGWHYCGTLDNHSTTEQIKFLAQVYQATQRNDCLTGVQRGLEWLFKAQFPNGGWPQVFPLEPGYHEAITLNDDAMLHVLDLLLSVSHAEAPFSFIDPQLKTGASRAYERGIRCIINAQVLVDGHHTVWCAQHDPLDLKPVPARLKEPASLSGGESANLLHFLMRKGPITAEVIGVVESALAWLDQHKISGMRKTRNAQGKTDYVKDSGSTEILWARFYDVTTGEPIFAGSQDGIIYHSYHEMAAKNKVSYDYFTTKPGEILEKEVNRWRKRLGTGKK